MVRPRPGPGHDAGPAVDHLEQFVLERRGRDGGLHRDLPGHVERRQRLIHRLHAQSFLSRLHGRVDLVHLVVTNQVPDRRRRHEDLETDDAPGPLRATQQRLADDALEHHRELGADLSLLVRREHIDHAVDRLRRRVGVQRGEGEVPRLRDPQRGLDRLEVPHFADQDDIRVLAERGAQRGAERRGVGMHLALVHEAVLVLVDVLDRVLDRENVLLALGVDLVDHRGERGGLAAAGRAGDQHQALRPLGELGDDRRQAEIVEAADAFRDQPEDGRDGAALVEQVAAEAAHPAHAEREVQLEALLEPLLLHVRAHAVGELLGLRGREQRQVEPLQLAVHPDDRG